MGLIPEEIKRTMSNSELEAFKREDELLEIQHKLAKRHRENVLIPKGNIGEVTYKELLIEAILGVKLTGLGDFSMLDGMESVTGSLLLEKRELYKKNIIELSEEELLTLYMTLKENMTL